MAKTVIHELVERIIVEDKSGNALSKVADQMDYLYLSSAEAAQAVSWLSSAISELSSEGNGSTGVINVADQMDYLYLSSSEATQAVDGLSSAIDDLSSESSGSTAISDVADQMDSVEQSSGRAIKGADAFSIGLNALTNVAKFGAQALLKLLEAAGKLGLYLAERGLKEMLQEEQATLALTYALQQQGIYTDDLRDKIVELASTQQYQIGVADDQIIAADSLLVTTGIQTDKLGELNEAIAALAARSAMAGDGQLDFASTAEAVSKALNGQGGALDEYGINLDGTRSKADRFNAIIEQARKNLPLLASQVNSTAGVWKLFQLAIDDGAQSLFKSRDSLDAIRGIMQGIIPVMREWPKYFTDAFDAIQGGSGDTKETIRNMALAGIDAMEQLYLALFKIAEFLVDIGKASVYVKTGLRTTEQGLDNLSQTGNYGMAFLFDGFDGLNYAMGAVNAQYDEANQKSYEQILTLERLETTMKQFSASGVNAWDAFRDAIKKSDLSGGGEAGGSGGGGGGGMGGLKGAAADATAEIEILTRAVEKLSSTLVKVGRVTISKGATDALARLNESFPMQLRNARQEEYNKLLENERELQVQLALANDPQVREWRKRSALIEQYIDALQRKQELEIENLPELRKMNRLFETQKFALGQAEQALSSMGSTFADVIGDLMVGEAVDAKDAVKSLVRSIATQLVGALIQFGIQQVMNNAYSAVEIQQNNIKMKQIGIMIGLYSALAIAKTIAKMHGGGEAGAGAGDILSSIGDATGFVPAKIGAKLLHSGGELPRAHGGLRSDEVGPFILQRGEFVLQRSAVQAIGAANVAQMNRSGKIPGGHTINLTVNAGAGSDGKRIGRSIIQELNWASRTGKLQLDQRSIVR